MGTTPIVIATAGETFLAYVDLDSITVHPDGSLTCDAARYPRVS